MKPHEIARLQVYLRARFNTPQIKVVLRGEASDSVEVAIGDEFIGVIYKDDEEGEVSYAFHMSILDEDLPKDV